MSSSAVSSCGGTSQRSVRPVELAAGSEIPCRQADVLYCRALLDRDALPLLAAAERYDAVGRSLQKAKALEAAAAEFARAGHRDQARTAFAGAVEAYTALGAAADLARLRATPR
jgi:hypothetical protein